MIRSVLFLVLLLVGCTSSVDVDNKTEESEITTSSLSSSRSHVEVYDNGQVKIKGRLVDEQREGVWISYYENGVKWSEEYYRDGRRNGASVAYYPSGIMRYRGNYIEDKRAGTWQFYEEDGILAKEVDFNLK